MTTQQKSGGQLHAILAIIILIASTILFFIPVLFIGLMKLIPNLKWRVACTRLIDRTVTLWIDLNNAYINQMPQLTWNITGLSQLDPNKWYLIIANHQSWSDIVILQYLFNRKVPLLKFFIKDQLKWVPLLGFAWWAMGCPFMKRYSKDYLANNPHKKGKDLEATRKALELFQHTPSTIINFVEGTRFTAAKNQSQQSPYQHLLKPRAGGISFVIGALGTQITSLVDTTIIYSNDKHSLWDFLCRRINNITIHLREIPIPPAFTNPLLLNEEHTQYQFREWLNEQWLEKDRLITELKMG